MKYAADFETTTDPDDCRVWAWALSAIDDPEQVETGINLDHFFARLARKDDPAMVWFHNLKFDGEFILHWLFTNGFTWQKDSKELTSLQFSTLITADGKFYEIIVMYHKKGKKSNKVTFRDSLKLLPFSVDAVAKSFKLPFQKLELDYTKPRPVGYQLDAAEQAYLENDVKIMAKALQILFAQDLTRMTLGANALADFKKTLTFYEFDRHFPVPVYDEELRQAYHGGYCIVNPLWKNKEVWDGIVLDVNSLYPWVMKAKPLPYGEGLYFEGRYKKNVLYDTYFQALNCQFKLKPGHLPIIANREFRGVAAEYLTSSKNEVLALYLTSVDEALFFQHYDVYNIEWVGGWAFRSKIGVFDAYIEKWTAIKIRSKEEGNRPMYIIAKLMLNSLYGKLATNPNCQSKIPYWDRDRVEYMNGPHEKREPLYIPAAAFITAWARHTTITAAQANIERFRYCDTDSLHLAGTEMPEGLKIDPLELGAWKHELTFRLAKFIRPKCYMEYGREPGEAEDKWRVTAAGLPISCHAQVTWSNFKPGATFTGKLVPRRVRGGVVLEKIDFTLALH